MSLLSIQARLGLPLFKGDGLLDYVKKDVHLDISTNINGTSFLSYNLASKIENQWQSLGFNLVAKVCKKYSHLANSKMRTYYVIDSRLCILG